MSQNPYESPRELGPLTTGKIVKRGLGVGVIVLLTPVVVGIAFFASCAAVDSYARATLLSAEGPESSMLAWMIVAWMIFLLPPGVTLAGMIWWAVWAHRRGKRLPKPTDPSNAE